MEGVAGAESEFRVEEVGGGRQVALGRCQTQALGRGAVARAASEAPAQGRVCAPDADGLGTATVSWGCVAVSTRGES